MSYLKPNIEAMTAYVPGEQPADVTKVVKLNQNENPYPPSPKALAVLREYDGAQLRLYPDPLVTEFRQAAAEVAGVPVDWILPGDGSDDLIIMIARAAAGPGKAVAYPVPTFPFYFTQGQVEAAPLVEIPYNDDFSLPLEAMAKADAALTFIANPNSPTGSTASVEQLDWLAGKLNGLLVIDEAYADFADSSAISLALKRQNVIIMRSLSKGYSLAGLRLGFGIANPALMAGLLKTKAIYNVGSLPAAVGAAALRDRAYHDRCVAKIRGERARLVKELTDRGFKVWPSQANFLMVTVPGSAWAKPSYTAAKPGGDGREVFEALKARNVLVRYFNEDRMRDKLRISVGTPKENDTLLAAMDAIRTKVQK